MRPAGLDHFLISHQRVPRAQALHMLLVIREWGDRPFSAREIKLAHYLHGELGRWWRADAGDAILRLPPRLRETLGALLVGDSEKQAADRLGVRPATLHDYVKTLPTRLRVHSRGELLAHAARPPRSPRLVLEGAPVVSASRAGGGSADRLEKAHQRA